jgi:hypothetical protein
LTITHETLCQMLDYPSRDHWRSRPMTRQQATALSPTDRKLRRMAKGRLRKLKPTKTFTYIPDVASPPPMDAHRDYLSLTDPDRDIIRV